ncbi:hypothetical protein SAMN02745229_02492 [Butyrivibrio fibrisolvens DSM 3071]|uniref:AAA domain-containing protein n=1 Tax=Butyrivibrio fibrisolvens DSM 3071 TaxID=1121131 RepID=A0A1M5ZPB2_BUTFI|nr:hypothetical protein [Butyrivibrio fibrisolvens]SHI25936.1 hypothetical protein SAMN02745229_02492 [Butyrivibrio fibrisolvens DSM 3071]
MSKRNIIAVCDNEADYCFRLDEYLRRNLKLPFRIVDFTNEEDLKAYDNELKKQTIALVVSQSVYDKVGDAGFERLLILEEPSKDGSYKEVESLDDDIEIRSTPKYQSMDKIMQKLMDFCMDKPDTLSSKQRQDEKLTIYGVYSPVKRCGQTTFAKALGEILGRNGRTLYMNLEAFATDLGIHASPGQNLQDLLYHFENDKQRLSLYLERVCVKQGNLDIVPPATSFLTLKGIEKEEWIHLIQEIEKTGLYKYLVLDLSEVADGFTDILSMCDRVFTIRRSDRQSLSKLETYGRTIRLSGNGHILDKSMVFDFPDNLMDAGNQAIEVYVNNVHEASKELSDKEAQNAS